MKPTTPPYQRHLIASLLAATMAFGLAACSDDGNNPPVASAGVSQNVTSGTTVTLDASGSTDPDGNVLTYNWTITSRPAGSTAAIVNPTLAKASFTPDLPGTYTAKVTVSDGTTSTDASVTVTASDVVGFDWMPATLPASYPSYGFAADSINSIGDQVTLKPGSPHTLAGFEAVFVSWSCESGEWNTTCVTTPGSSFQYPATVKFYNAAGALLATKTQTFTIPYRPTSDPTCPTNTNYRNPAGGCSSGLAFKVAFDLRSLKATVPDSFYYEISVNTSASGPAPTGGPATAKYNSINLGAYYPVTTLPTVGSDPEIGFMRLNGADSNESADLPSRVIMAAP